MLCTTDVCMDVINGFSKKNEIFFLPETWRKQCVSTAIASPEANDVERRTDETEAPIPAPAAAPQTIKTYRNDAIHSDIIAL